MVIMLTRMIEPGPCWDFSDLAQCAWHAAHILHCTYIQSLDLLVRQHGPRIHGITPQMQLMQNGVRMVRDAVYLTAETKRFNIHGITAQETVRTQVQTFRHKYRDTIMRSRHGLWWSSQPFIPPRSGSSSTLATSFAREVSNCKERKTCARPGTLYLYMNYLAGCMTV
jgi:hypothetical protein